MTLVSDPPVVAPEPEAPAPPTRGPRQAMSWMRSWRVPVRLAQRDLRRRPGRTVLVALLVAVPVTALALLDVSYRTTQAAQGAWIPEVFGTADAIATLPVEPDAAHCPDCLARADVETALPDGTRQLWSTQAGIPLRTPEQRKGLGVRVANTDVADPLYTGSYSLVSGRWPTADNQVALQPDLAKFLGVTVGDEFSLVHQSRRFEVVGLIDRGGWQSAQMIAPGFDFSVVRPRNLSDVGAFDLPSSFDVHTTDMNLGLNGEVQIRPGSNGAATYTDSEQAAVDQSLILGWLGGVLAMSVLGVVIAAAFAISGRRQLVAIGQLSASGASRQTLARTFGLYGAFTAAVGVAVGLLAALVIYLRWPINSQGHAVVNWLDIAVIAVTAIAVATFAALAPTRSLTRVSVLSALAGRRPVGAVPGWLTRAGVALFAGGLLVTFVATRSGADGGGEEAGMLVALGMIAAVLGVCALAPRIVDRFGSLASRRGGSIRLAARSITRHRPRAAAVLASLLVVGMVAAGVAAAAEYRMQENEAEAAADLFTRSDLVWAQSSGLAQEQDGSLSTTPLALENVGALQADAESAIGPSTWTSAPLAYQPLQADTTEAFPFALVATDEILDLFGLSAASRQAIAGEDGPVLLIRRTYTDLVLPGIVAPELEVELPWPLISPLATQNEGWAVVPQAVTFGVAGHDLTQKDWDALWLLSQDSSEGLAYVGVDESGQSTTWSLSYYASSHQGFRLTAAQVRIALVVVPLLLVMLLVSIGMALWAVESRDERDVLVAVGASPATLARFAGWRAGGLTFGAMLIAVPMGLCVAWAVARAAHGFIAIPWLLGGLLLFAVPAVIGVGALACSALAQRIRPVRMSTLTAD